jgi:hypothetical protein
MDEHIQEVYLLEAATQCQFAINAVHTLNDLIPKWEEATHNGNVDLQTTLHYEIFRTIHSLLTHASNVSKLFWPGMPRRRSGESDADFHSRCYALPKLARAAELRGLLALPEDSHALKSRKLRDHLEHFDERLDHWQASSFSKNYFHDSIGSREYLSGVNDIDIMRWYDPSRKRMLFRGESFDLQELVNGITDVLTKLESFHVKP